jgi:uncharacterized protein YybS (DUF2232 family)
LVLYPDHNKSGIVPETIQGIRIKDITHGVFTTLLAYVLATSVPILGFFFALTLPLPALFYRVKMGSSGGTLVPAISALAIILFAGGLSADVVFSLELILLGFILGDLYGKKLSVEKTILYACGAIWGCALALLIVYSQISGNSMRELISGYVAKNLEITLALYQSMDIPEESIQVLSNALPSIQYVLVRLVPAFVAVSTLFVSWSNILISRPILSFKNLPVPDFGVLNHWRSPENFVWVAIGCGGLLLVPDKTIRMIGLNGVLVAMTVYFFQGIAIVAWFFQSKQVPRAMRIMFYCLIGIQQIFLLIVIGIGFFDLWANFRKLPSSSTTENVSE